MNSPWRMSRYDVFLPLGSLFVENRNITLHNRQMKLVHLWVKTEASIQRCKGKPMSWKVSVTLPWTIWWILTVFWSLFCFETWARREQQGMPLKPDHSSMLPVLSPTLSWHAEKQSSRMQKNSSTKIPFFFSDSRTTLKHLSPPGNAVRLFDF